uniref:Transmembrane protein 132D n=1 Tax=Electrophorus electricus TaxID=8005 RepID=A0AAY5E7B5_ELEEL
MEVTAVIDFLNETVEPYGGAISAVLHLYLIGEETRGRVRMMVNFTYSYLSAQLEISVWVPHLPLQVDIPDPELSQIKGWRVPVSGYKKLDFSIENEEGKRRKGRGCLLQYQHRRIQVLVTFTAESAHSEAPSPVYFLGSDVSVAQLQAGTVLSGRAPGITRVPGILLKGKSFLQFKGVVRVLDDKVSITELGVQLVSGLSLNLQLSTGSSRAIVATTTTQDTMHNPKQMAVVACWVLFRDGSQAPLDLFDPSGYMLTLNSLDKRVASVRMVPGPAVVAEAEGQALLLRAELAICDTCQKSKRKSALATGTGNVRVKFLSAEQRGGVRRRTWAGARGLADHGTCTEPVDSESKVSLTSSHGLVEIPRNTFTATFTDSSEKKTKEHPRLAENNLFCIYSLVVVSCLAVIAFLLNCATHSARSRSKNPPEQCQGPDQNRHQWVCLGIAAEQDRAKPIATTYKQQVPSTCVWWRVNYIKYSFLNERLNMGPLCDLNNYTPTELFCIFASFVHFYEEK